MYESCVPCDELSTARPAPTPSDSSPFAPLDGPTPVSPAANTPTGNAALVLDTPRSTSLASIPAAWQQSNAANRRVGCSAATSAAKVDARSDVDRTFLLSTS